MRPWSPLQQTMAMPTRPISAATACAGWAPRHCGCASPRPCCPHWRSWATG